MRARAGHPTGRRSSRAAIRQVARRGALATAALLALAATAPRASASSPETPGRGAGAAAGSATTRTAPAAIAPWTGDARNDAPASAPASDAPRRSGLPDTPGPGTTSAIASTRPAGLETPALEAMWRHGIRLERRDLYLEAAAVYEHMTREAPDVPYGYWKVSRNYWRFAEGLPAEAKDLRLPYFELADAWATRGLAVERDCAECMLWKFGAMGRIGTTRGVLRSLRLAPEMRDLIERGIALRPTYRDDFTNSTLGNLYYAGAVFYRVVPEWTWLDWLIGVRGDMDRALDMIREAVALDGERVDYQVELGAALLCFAERRDDDAARREALTVLARVPDLPRRFATDATDVRHAATLRDRPALACGYSRDGWIDVEAERRATRR
jgi:hypothetical protein